MSDPIDISVALHGGLPIWPDSAGYAVEQTRSFAKGDDVFVSRIEMDVHSGTHVEGPLHYLDGGEGLDATPLARFVGPAYVADLRAAETIGSDELDAADVPKQTERLLLRTTNSDLWRQEAGFRTDYVALSAEGARWIAQRGIGLVGIDYLSVQRFQDDAETHRILLRGGVTILEGLDLSGANAGQYRLTCLPLKLMGTEAAPARAILEPLP